MNQYETKLLNYLRSENEKTGNNLFAFVNVLSNIGDFGGPEMLERTFSSLEDKGLVKKTSYIGTYQLL